MYGKKGKRTCVLLAIGEQEREIQSHQSPETKRHMYGKKPKGHVSF